MSILIKGMEMPKDGAYWCEIGVAGDIAVITIHGEDRKSFHLVPTVDAVPVCRCKDCVHGIEEDGGIKCVASADYDEMSNDWFGFVSWHEQDWFCADGERKGGDE